VSESRLFAGRSAVVALFSVAGAALIAATTLTAVVISADTPEWCCDDSVRPVAEQAPANAKAATDRPVGLPMCLIGTWRSVEDSSMVKFYSDQPPMRFNGAGRFLSLRPDGTGSERHENFTLNGNFGSRALRLVSNGTMTFKWTASDKTITYIGHVDATITYAYYDHRGLLETQPLKLNPNLNEVDRYTCQPSQLAEDSDTGYRSVWVRVPESGVYGR
jgi:hypothetical protein